MGLRTLGKPFNRSKIKTKDVVDTQATVHYRHTVQYKTHTVQRHTRGSIIHQRRSALHALFGRGILPYMQQNISSHAACCSVGLIEGGIVLQACLMVPCRALNGAAALFRLLKGERRVSVLIPFYINTFVAASDHVYIGLVNPAVLGLGWKL